LLVPEKKGAAFAFPDISSLPSHNLTQSELMEVVENARSFKGIFS
jgi:hypothetical protein